jgi:hypothetical protein
MNIYGAKSSRERSNANGKFKARCEWTRAPIVVFIGLQNLLQVHFCPFKALSTLQIPRAEVAKTLQAQREERKKKLSE